MFGSDSNPLSDAAHIMPGIMNMQAQMMHNGAECAKKSNQERVTDAMDNLINLEANLAALAAQIHGSPPSPIGHDKLVTVSVAEAMNEMPNQINNWVDRCNETIAEIRKVLFGI